MYSIEDVRAIAREIPDGMSYATQAEATGTDLNMGCRYRSDDGRPVCMVGWILDRFGLLKDLDEEDNYTSVANLALFGDNFSGDSIHLMEEWQVRQDTFRAQPWARIVEGE